ncbi:MAG: MliC family protein [Candidatus Paceibacterota bacterium]|jgi:hypothetical protein
MKKNLVLIFVIIIILAAAVWYVNRNKGKNPVPPSSLSFVAQANYVCNGGGTIDATFYKGEAQPVKPGEPPIPSGMVKIILSDGRTFNLSQTISADGGRYANSDESFVFWSKGDGAMVLEDNIEKNYTGCVASTK